MIRPVGFRMNEQTAVNNYYQKHLENVDAQSVQSMAADEFDEFVGKLTDEGIEVIVVEDTENPDTPDSIFPNNWISFHADGRVGLYPMFAENRRLERREEIIHLLSDGYQYQTEEIVDFTEFEDHSKFLEGTGSLVLDRENKIAYLAISPRSDEQAALLFCEAFGYTPVLFHAYQTVGDERMLIYHTNVMMCVGKNIAVVCSSCIDDEEERTTLLKSFSDSGKDIVEISEEQTQRFAGNMLELVSKDGQSLMVMSQSARDALTPEQVSQIEKQSKIVSSSLNTIEACGGGSARCMMAEVFLPKNAES
jgi:hypothetical protein